MPTYYYNALLCLYLYVTYMYTIAQVTMVYILSMAYMQFYLSFLNVQYHYDSYKGLPIVSYIVMPKPWTTIHTDTHHTYLQAVCMVYMLPHS